MGKRKVVQLVWTLITNSNFGGFVSGKIYKGPLKNICVPGMNCYSCPGAVGSCPIGAMQAVGGASGKKISFYVVGFIILIGALFGRFVCGWLCPFGLFQELLNKIPFVKKIEGFRRDKLLRKLKYLILLVFVILLPVFITNSIGIGAPYFCELICPVGTLEGGVILVILNKSLRAAIGWLYAWKIFILLATILLSIMIYRPFCKYICPLGAAYSLFNPIAVFGYQVDMAKCTGCKTCSRACKMGVDPVEEANHPECVHCNACRDICPENAIEKCKIFRKKTYCTK